MPLGVKYDITRSNIRVDLAAAFTVDQRPERALLVLQVAHLDSRKGILSSLGGHIVFFIPHTYACHEALAVSAEGTQAFVERSYYKGSGPQWSKMGRVGYQ